MNVAIITDSFPPMVDGVSRCAFGYAHALHKRGDTCVVITPQVPGAVYDYPFPVYGFKSVKVPYADYRAGHPFMPKLTAALKDMKIDIIHTHSPFVSTTIARQLRGTLNVPVVFTQHTKWDMDIARAVPLKVLQKSLKMYVYNNINAADDVWVVSRGAGEYMQEHGYKGSYIVMPNGTDFPLGDADVSFTRQINSTYDLPEDVPVMLFVGRMMWYKNIRLIMDALRLLRDKRLDFRMLFVGDGEDLDDAVKYTADAGLSGRVFFTGRVSDRELLRAYFTRSDLFVFPSVYDNAPLVIREAAACFCPSLVVRGSSASEILEDGVTGFFAYETPESVADTIEAVLSDKARLGKAAAAAHEQVYWHWDRAIEDAVARYQAVIEQYRGKR